MLIFQCFDKMFHHFPVISRENNIVLGTKSSRARKAGAGTTKKPRCQSLFFASVLHENAKRSFGAGIIVANIVISR
jgi:hypothetical protein